MIHLKNLRILHNIQQLDNRPYDCTQLYDENFEILSTNFHLIFYPEKP